MTQWRGPTSQHHRGLQWPATDNHEFGLEVWSETKWIDKMAEWIGKMAEWIGNHESGIKRSGLRRWLSGTKWSGVHWIGGEQCVVERSEWRGKAESSRVEWIEMECNSGVASSTKGGP